LAFTKKDKSKIFIFGLVPIRNVSLITCPTFLIRDVKYNGGKKINTSPVQGRVKKQKRASLRRETKRKNLWFSATTFPKWRATGRIEIHFAKEAGTCRPLFGKRRKDGRATTVVNKTYIPLFPFEVIGYFH